MSEDAAEVFETAEGILDAMPLFVGSPVEAEWFFDPLLAPNVGQQMRFDARPLLITQPEQVASHLPRFLLARNH